MRPGCGCGCLTVVLGILLVLGGLWFGRALFDRPQISYEVGTPAEGRRAQQKLFELSGTITPRRRDQRTVTVTLSERELNAFLTRHIADELPLSEGAIHLVGNGIVEITGRLPLHGFLGDSISSIARALPERWTGQPVWLRLRGHLRLETGAARAEPRRLRLEPESVWVGSRRLPVAVLTMLPDGPAPRATRWPISETIDSILVEPGRLTITRRS